MVFTIEPSFELSEVLNEFPVLRKSLSKLDFHVEEVVEGESIQDFFEKKDLEEEEISLLVRILNRDVKSFLKRSKDLE